MTWSWVTKGGEVIKASGLKQTGGKDPPVCSGRYVPKANTSSSDLPVAVDLRRHMTPIEDQRGTNSCAAAAAAGAYEYLMKRWQRKNKPEERSEPDVSRLFIYYVGRKRDLKNNSAEHLKVKDVGMSIGSAIQALHDKGVCGGEAWPFEKEKVDFTPQEIAFDLAEDYKIAESQSVPVDLEKMKQALADGYPIITGLKLTKTFFKPGPRGKVKTPDPTEEKSASHGLHCMLIVGYCDKEEVFVYRNSWGERWADKGYAYVPYDYAAHGDFNFCGQYIIKGLKDLDMTPNLEDHDWTDLIDDENEDGDDDECDSEEEDEPDDEEDEEWNPDMFDTMTDLRKVFDRLDQTDDGRLGFDELQQGFWKMGRYASTDSLKKLMAKFDVNGSGHIGFAEFCAMNGVDYEASKSKKSLPSVRKPIVSEEGEDEVGDWDYIVVQQTADVYNEPGDTTGQRVYCLRKCAFVESRRRRTVEGVTWIQLANRCWVCEERSERKVLSEIHHEEMESSYLNALVVNPGLNVPVNLAAQPCGFEDGRDVDPGDIVLVRKQARMKVPCSDGEETWQEFLFVESKTDRGVFGWLPSQVDGTDTLVPPSPLEEDSL